MSERLPEVGEEFVWMGALFVRTEGAIADDLFPVQYVETSEANSHLIGKPGLMRVTDMDEFHIIERCDKCGQQIRSAPSSDEAAK